MPADSRQVTEDDEGLALPADAFRDILMSVLAKGGSVRFKAGGLSMFPFIHDGDVLTIRPLRPHAAETGDLIAFSRPESDRILVHRVVLKRPNGLVTRGDATMDADGLIPFDRVLGRVSRVERNGRQVRMGTNLEQRLVAMLSLHGWLTPLMARYRSLRSAWERLR